MLKTFRGHDAAFGIRRPEPGVVRARLGVLVRFLGMAVAAFVLSRAVFLGGLAPFALALFAAGVLAGRHIAALLAGCVLGSLNASLADINLSLPVGCAVILAGDLLSGAAAPGLGRLRAALKRAPAIQARSPNRARMVRAAALAGLGTLGPGLVMARGEPWASAQATGAALMALAAAPFMVDVLALSPRRRFLLAEERVGLGLLCVMLAAGLYALWPPLSICLSMAALLVGSDFGALLGVGLGGAILVVSGDARGLAALGLGGAAAQLCAGLPAGTRALSATAAAALTAWHAGFGLPELAGFAAAAPAAMLLPEPARRRANAWFRRPAEGCDPDRLAGLLRARTVGRLRAMGAAFGELAEGYLTPGVLPDEQALMSGLRAALCGGCPGFDACWAGEDNRAARLMCDLAAMAVAWSEGSAEGPLFGDDVPPELARRCRRSRLIPERLGGMLEDFARARRGALKRDGENRLISAQFLQARQLLEGLAAQQSQPVRLRDRQAHRAAGVLERAGIELSDAMLLTERRAALILTLRDGVWTPDLAARAAAALCRAFGRVYRPEAAGGRTLCFARLPRLTAETGIATLSRQAGAPSGDSHLAAVLEGETLMAVICDGMGSGEAASKESASAVRLLGRFLASGAAWPLAVETVNALMLNAGAEDMFSTMDLMMLDLTSGLAEFVKLAACPALIVRDGAVERVEGGRLPLGILERVQPAASRVQLAPGDVVLMASDGVMDAADAMALEAALIDCADGDMNALAERVLRLAEAGAPTGHRDDMTAVCVRLARRDAAA